MEYTDTNYVVAGGYNFLGQVYRRLPILKSDYNVDISKDQIINVLSNILSKSLFSYGTNLSKKTKTIKSVSKYNESIKNALNVKFSSILPDNFKVFLDSGGFQLSMGYLNENEIFKFIDMYINFLQDNSNLFDYAFSLDIPPNEITFKSYDDIYDWNKKSYSKLQDLSPEIREKIIYVYHFRTPIVNNIWMKILFQDGLAQELNIKRWSVGGVVSGLKGEDEIPYISYSIPLTIILDYVKNHTDQTSLYFHVLGGSTYRDILFYQFCKLHVKRLHNVDITFTFDSSGLFKQLMMGRFLDVLQPDLTVNKLFLTTSMLDISNHDFNQKRNREVCYNICKVISNEYNLPDISNIPIYEDHGPFSKPIEMYLCFYMLHFYTEIQKRSEIIANEIYPLYNDNRLKFDKILFDYLQKLNRGTVSKRLKSKALAFSRSLDLLTNLDTNKALNLINKYMVKDEFKSLVRKIVTF